MRSSLPSACTLILIAIMAFPYGILNSASPWSSQVNPSIRVSSSQIFSGILNIVWGDPKVGTGGETRYAIALVNGTSVPLQLTGQLNTAIYYFGKRVLVTGHVVPNQFATTHAEASTAILVDTIGPQQGVTAATSGVFGTRKVIYLLLEFSDDSAVPHPPLFYTDLNNPDTPPAGEVFPSTVNGFFKKTSWNQFYWLGDVGGVGGVGASGGWLTLPHPKSYYAPCDWSNSCANLQAIGDDGTALGMAQGIIFKNYDNINFVLSNDLDCCAWGGDYYSSVDDKSYGATWEPPWGQEAGTYSHEMGHSIGLPHSGWVYYAYDSPWDIMSARTSANTVNCGSYYSDNSGGTSSIYCTEPGDGYNAAYKDYLGWIPSANEVVTDTSSSATVTLEADALPLGTATKMIKICITGSPCTGSTAHYFTVEARVGGYQFDNGLPGEGVIIQMFEGDRPAVGGACFFNSQSGWAWPIDATPGDWDGPPACSSGGRSYPDYALFNAQWIPSQTYVNATYGLRVNVVARNGSSFVIAVNPAMTVSYSISGGGTSYLAPVFNYVQGGISEQYTLTTTATAIQIDQGSSWSVTPNPLSGSTSSERWYSNQVLSGTASSTTMVFTFYHQYLMTLSYASTGPSSSFQEWTTPSNNAGPWGIGVDSFGNTWFTENQSNRLAMLNPTTNTYYEMNTPSSSPRGLVVKTVALSGYISTRVYFTEWGSDKVAFFDNNTGTPYRFTEYQLRGGSKPVNMAIDDQGFMYFTESGRDIIGVLDPNSNTLTEWTLPGATTSPGSNNNLGNLGVWGISVQVVNSQSGTNRLVWFTELTGDTIGRINTSTGDLFTYDISNLGVSAHHRPAGIVATPATCSSSTTTCSNSEVYFSTTNTNQISVIGPTDAISNYNLFGGIGGNAKPTAVAFDSTNNRLWFPESNAGNIGFIDTTFTQPTQIVPTSLCTLASGNSGNCPVPASTTTPTVQPCTPSSSAGSGANQCTLSSPSTIGTSQTVTTQSPGPASTLSTVNALNGAYEYALPSTGSQPQSVALDPSGNVWVTENANSANKIGLLGYSAPVFTANQFGSLFGQALRTTAEGFWFDTGSPWSVTNPLSGSTSSEQSATSQPTSGTISSSQTIAFSYQHQYLVSFQTNPSSSALISWSSCGAPGEGDGQSAFETNYGSVTACYVPSGYTLSSWSCSGGLACSGSENPTVVTFTGPGTITLNLKTGGLLNPASTLLTATATPGSVSSGTSFTVSGSLTSNGVGLSGEQILLVFNSGSNIIAVTTQSNGSFSEQITAPISSGSYNVQVYFLGDYGSSTQYLPSAATATITVT